MASWVTPGSPLGQVVAAAFDRGMPPEDWAAGTRPPADPAVRETPATIWQSQVLPAFAEHFGLRLVPWRWDSDCRKADLNDWLPRPWRNAIPGS